MALSNLNAWTPEEKPAAACSAACGAADKPAEEVPAACGAAEAPAACGASDNK